VRPGLLLAVSLIWLGFAAASLAQPVATDSQLQRLHSEAPALDPEILELALTARSNAEEEGLLKRPEILTVIDYSLPSTEPRFWVFDLKHSTLLHRELVAHGRNTGENWARAFSNRLGSKQSSLGLFTTAGTYYGRNGYSLYLHGLEEGVNDKAFERTIVMHGAWYVNRAFAREHGRLGRSWGCPALRQGISREVIDQIKGGSALFVYYPDKRWLGSSEFLDPASSSRVTSKKTQQDHTARLKAAANTRG